MTSRKISMVPKSFCESLISNNGLNHPSDTVHQIIQSAFSFIIETVKGGKKVNFPNFIKFDRVTRNARSFKNPTKTKEGEEPVHREDIKKPARYALRVTVMNHLRDAFEDIEIQSDDAEVEATDATDATDAEAEAHEEEVQPVKKGKAKAVKEVKAKKEEVKEAVKAKAAKAKSAPKSKKSSKNQVVEEAEEPEVVEEVEEEPVVDVDKEINEKKEKNKPPKIRFGCLHVEVVDGWGDEEPEVIDVEEKEIKEKKDKKKPSKKAKKVDEVDMVQEKYELDNLSD